MSKPIVSVNIMGGLGNQLFQVATAYAYALRENGQLQIEHKTDNGNRPLYFDNILRQFKQFIVPNVSNNLTHWNESAPTKYSEIGTLHFPGKYLHGYLQSSKYFYNDMIKNQIKTMIKPDTITSTYVNEKYKYLLENASRVVVIHCRRTDYIKAANFHGPLQGTYYKQAIEKILNFVEDPIFLLCGDDNNFWNEIQSYISIIYKYQTIIMPEETDINTFTLLQQFNNFIISNSTFIWWTAWLADAKNVIAPSKWFGPEGPQDYEDIYESHWIRI